MSLKVAALTYPQVNLRIGEVLGPAELRQTVEQRLRQGLDVVGPRVTP